MFISEKFKTAVRNLPTIAKTKLELSMDDFMQDFDKICKSLPKENIIQSETSRHFLLHTLTQKEEYNITCIDDEFIRAWDDLIRWAPIFPFVADIYEEFAEPLFAVGDIVRLKDKKTIRGLGMYGALVDSTFWERFTVGVPSVRRDGKRWFIVAVHNWNGEVLEFYEKILTAARWRDILWYHYKKVKAAIKKDLVNNRAQNIQRANEDYQQAVRLLMEKEERLHNTLIDDMNKEVERIFQMRMCAKEEIMKMDLISRCDVSEDKLYLETRCLTYSTDNKTYPLGWYKVTFDKGSKNTKIINWVGLEGNQGLHVFDNGRCCLGERAPLISKAMAEKDDIQLAMIALEFLQHYNPGSPVTNLLEFMSRHQKKFEKAAKDEKPKEVLVESVSIDEAKELLKESDNLELDEGEDEDWAPYDDDEGVDPLF